MKTIVIFISLSILFIWFIINTIYFFKKLDNVIREANKDVQIIVKCEKCKNEHNSTVDEFLSTKMSKTKSITVSANIGILGASGTHYKYVAKKFYCPICNKKTWSEVKDYDKLAIKNAKLAFPFALKYFTILLLGGLIIKFITEIFI